MITAMLVAVVLSRYHAQTTNPITIEKVSDSSLIIYNGDALQFCLTKVDVVTCYFHNNQSRSFKLERPVN